MTGNISNLSDFEEFNEGYVAFGGNPKGGKISGKGKIKTGKLDFDDVYFVKELKFNLFSVSQMCDKKSSVLFTDTECVVLSSDFKLPDDNHVLLRVPREKNMYNVDLKNVVSLGDLTCLFAKATLDESNLWHRRLGHINFKTMNKLVKDPLGKFDGKADEGFLVGYSVNSKAFRVLNSRTIIVQKTLHINFLENQPKVARSGPKWLFDIDNLTMFMNYQPVVVGNQPNHNAGIQENLDSDPQNTDADVAFDVKETENEVHVSLSSSDKPNKYDEKAKRADKGKSHVDLSTGVRDLRDKFKEFCHPSATAVSPYFRIARKSSFVDPSNYLVDLDMPALKDIIYSDDEEDVGAEADLLNLETNISVSPILTTRVHKDHPVTQIIGDLTSAPQTRSMARMEEGIDYDEVFAPVAKIEAIRLFLAYASFMGFMVYQMDVKSVFLYGTIKEEVYVCQPPGFEDPDYPDKVYKVVKALYGLHQAPRVWKLGFTDVKSASTPIETKKSLLKDPDGEDVDVRIYREAGGKDRPPMLASGNYVQWKSRIKRYIDTKPNHELSHYCLKNPPYKFMWADKEILIFEGSSITTIEMYMENYKNVSQDIRDQLNAEAEAVQIILTGIDTDIYSTVDAFPNACEMNQYDVTNHQVNVQFLLQLQPKWQRFMTLVKQSQELKTVSYHKLYDILKQHQNEVNELRAKRIARTANPLALVAQQQPVYNPQNHPPHYTQNSSTRSQQAATKNKGKATVNSPPPIYDQEPSMVAEDDEMSKDKEIDKLMALISLSFKKIYKHTNNNLRTSSNTSRANQDNSPRINRDAGYDNQRLGNVAGARETVGTTVVQKSGIQCYNCKEFGHVARECHKPKRTKDASYHRKKMLLCKKEEVGIQLNAEQADWRDDTDDESKDQELEAHYMYMAQI
nr:ribonuclease H-like domain-containing protein [Tanacetum cinerariifolium]